MKDEQATTVVDMDTLFNREVNEAEVNEVNRRSATPAGTYITNPDEYPINVFANTFNETDGGTRTVLTFAGLAQATIKGEDVTLRFRFRISPDARKKLDFETKEPTEKDDLPTRLYAQAVTAYRAQQKEAPKNVGQLVEWLKSSPIRVRTFVTQEGEPMVIAISAARR